MDRMNTIQFLRYIGTPLTKDEMMLLYKANNVKYDRCELYRDFITTLNLLIIDTYLGDDVMMSDSDVKKHFLWCYNRVMENFNSEGIPFGKSDGLRVYFFNFYNDVFYKEETKDYVIDRLNNLSDICFNYKRVKSRSDMDLLMELYKIFEKSLGKHSKKGY